MKNKWILFIWLTLPLISSAQNSTAPSTNNIFGIGVRTAVFQPSDLQGDVTPTSKVFANFDPTSNFRGELFFGYLSNSTKTGPANLELTDECTQMGFGAYYLKNVEKVRFAAGFRCAFFTAAADDVDYSISGAPEIVTSRNKGFTVGPVFGAEYFFSKSFSVGADFQLAISNSNLQPAGATSDMETKSTTTETNLMFRFYPF